MTDQIEQDAYDTLTMLCSIRQTLREHDRFYASHPEWAAEEGCQRMRASMVRCIEKLEAQFTH